jgi:OHCU decarboxylase
MTIPLATLNTMPQPDFIAALAGIFEHSPWVAETVAPSRPFASREALHAAMALAVAEAQADRQLALLRAHPVLAKRAPLTQASQSEQSGHGLQTLEADESRRFESLNDAYLARFGFPFIIAVRGQRDRAAILAALERRLQNPAETERDTALAEVAKIANFRLQDLLA